MSRRLSIALSGRVGQLAVDLRLETDLEGLTLITGPSGAGKTTLLRCLSGLTHVPGRITVDGTTWQDGPRRVPAHRREVGHVFQDNRLFSHLSVADNLRFGARRTTTPSAKGETKGETPVGAKSDSKSETASSTPAPATKTGAPPAT